MDCIFCKIRDRVIAKEFIYEDEDLMVFPDIHPLKPIHLLVVVKKHIEDYLDLADQVLTAKIKTVINKIIKDEGLDSKGYRISINGGGAQIIKHLHFHVMGPVGKSE